jgi:hypothetical protein
MYRHAVFFFLFLVLAGCGDRTSAPSRYAKLVELSPDLFRLEIKDMHWTPLFTASGFGGFRESIYFWVELNGHDSVFRDPPLHENGIDFHPSIGTITINREKGLVIIELKRIISGYGNLLKVDQSPANGTYIIK